MHGSRPAHDAERLTKSSAFLADQLEPFVLGEDRDTSVLGLGELGAGAGTRDYIVGLLRYRARGLGAEPLRHRLGLIPRHLLKRAGENDGLAGDDRIRARPL